MRRLRPAWRSWPGCGSSGIDGRRLTFSAQADGRARHDLRGHARALRGRSRALRGGGRAQGRLTSAPGALVGSRPSWTGVSAGIRRFLPPSRNGGAPVAQNHSCAGRGGPRRARARRRPVRRRGPRGARRSGALRPALLGERARRHRDRRQHRADLPGLGRRLRGGAGRGDRPEQQLRHAVRGRGRRPGDLQLQLRAARPARRGDRAVRRALLGRPDLGGRGTRRRGRAQHGRHRHGGHGRSRRRHCAGRRRGDRHHHRQRGQLPGVRRRHGAGAGRRRRQLCGVERAGRPWHQHLGRMVAGGGLPRPGRASAQPDRVRRLPVREPHQPLRHHPGQRLPRPPERPRARAAGRRGVRRRPRLARLAVRGRLDDPERHDGRRRAEPRGRRLQQLHHPHRYGPHGEGPGLRQPTRLRRRHLLG